MIGNDIIDLDLAHSESCIYRKGWMDKLFTIQEQCFIHEACDSELTAWLLWSMKEAVYKIVNRETYRRFYAPLLFTCQPEATLYSEETPGTRFLPSGSVAYRETIYLTYTWQKDGFLQTVAGHTGIGLRAITCSMLDTYSSSKRGNLISSLLCLTPYIFIKDRNGYPFLQHRVSGKQIPASLSHHGKYMAVSWLKGS